MSGDENTSGVLAGVLLPPFLAVSAVAAILTALFVWLGPGEAQEVASFGQDPSSAAASPTPTPPVSSPPASSPPPSSPTPSTPAPTTSAPESSETPDPDRPEVVVLNQSGGAGLAARVADRVREAGWEVNKVGNFNGTVSTTTVYHPASLRGPARALARDLPGNPRVMERFSNLSQTRLTIVLTDDYGD